ncbi:MAG: hypothetical protein AB8H80_10640 [Planctomycetota bacterium]
MEQVVMLVLPVLGIIFGYALIKSFMDQRAEARIERVKLLEEALRNPAMDRPTIESLTYQLTGARSRERGSSRLMAVVLAIGWITLFSGIGGLVYGEWVHDEDSSGGGVAAAIIGFGLVTYPFALRELTARSPAS